MTDIQPAVPNEDWLEPAELYLARGKEVEIDRPLFQGDVFSGVRLPILPSAPVDVDRQEVEFAESIVMIIPHPCQCYHGDKVRTHLTVAPVRQALDASKFGPEPFSTGMFDKFALPDLLNATDEDAAQSYVADFGKITSLPFRHLRLEDRVCCMSHMGIGVLSKRFIRFQSRMPVQLTQVMAASQDQWNESFLMQAWVRKYRKLKGYTNWCKEPTVIEGLGDGSPVAPRDYLTSSLDELTAAIEALPSS